MKKVNHIQYMLLNFFCLITLVTTLIITKYLFFWQIQYKNNIRILQPSADFLTIQIKFKEIQKELSQSNRTPLIFFQRKLNKLQNKARQLLSSIHIQAIQQKRRIIELMEAIQQLINIVQQRKIQKNKQNLDSNILLQFQKSNRQILSLWRKLQSQIKPSIQQFQQSLHQAQENLQLIQAPKDEFKFKQWYHKKMSLNRQIIKLKKKYKNQYKNVQQQFGLIVEVQTKLLSLQKQFNKKKKQSKQYFLIKLNQIQQMFKQINITTEKDNSLEIKKKKQLTSYKNLLRNNILIFFYEKQQQREKQQQIKQQQKPFSTQESSQPNFELPKILKKTTSLFKRRTQQQQTSSQITLLQNLPDEDQHSSSFEQYQTISIKKFQKKIPDTQTEQKKIKQVILPPHPTKIQNQLFQTQQQNVEQQQRIEKQQSFQQKLKQIMEDQKKKKKMQRRRYEKLRQINRIQKKQQRKDNIYLRNNNN